MSRKAKLLQRLSRRPRDFTWDEACSLMNACGFTLRRKSGSARLFVHSGGTRVRLHEPHPRPALLPYMIELLIEGLRAAGELDDEGGT